MKKICSLGVAGLLLFSLVLSGCGHLKKKEFEQQFSSYKQEVSGNFTKVDERITSLDKKVDQVAASSKEEAKKAKEEAIAAAEQGDADTLDAANKKAEAGDKAALEAAKKAALEAAESAKKSAVAAASLNTKNSIDEVLGTAKKAADEASLRANTTAEKALEETKKLNEALKAQAAKSEIPTTTINFSPGGTKVNDSHKAQLQQIADAVKSSPGAVVRIEGHADATPVIRSPYKNNWELSEARAKAVKDYLVKNLGVPGESIQIIAKAHYHPSASQVTKEGRDQNRRVEIRVTPPKS